MEFRSNEDIYQFAKKIALEFKEKGDISLFNDIMNALNYGVTASEQLGELRLVFQHIVAKDKYYSRKNDIEYAIKAINLAFKNRK